MAMGLSLKRGADVANEIWSGFYKGQQNQLAWEQEARAAEAAKRAQEIHERQKSEWSRQDEDRRRLEEAWRPRTVETQGFAIGDVEVPQMSTKIGPYFGGEAPQMSQAPTKRGLTPATISVDEPAADRERRVYEAIGLRDPSAALKFRSDAMLLGEKEEQTKAKAAGRDYLKRVEQAYKGGTAGMLDFLKGEFDGDVGDLGQGAYQGMKVEFKPAGKGKFERYAITTDANGNPQRRLVDTVNESDVLEQFMFRAGLGAQFAGGDPSKVLDYFKAHTKDKAEQRRAEEAHARTMALLGRQSAFVNAQLADLKREQRGDAFMDSVTALKTRALDFPANSPERKQLEGLAATYEQQSRSLKKTERMGGPTDERRGADVWALREKAAKLIERGPGEPDEAYFRRLDRAIGVTSEPAKGGVLAAANEQLGGNSGAAGGKPGGSLSVRGGQSGGHFATPGADVAQWRANNARIRALTEKLNQPGYTDPALRLRDQQELNRLRGVANAEDLGLSFAGAGGGR